MKKKLPRFIAQAKKNGNQSYKKCPVSGGYCFNPFCVLGCVEKF